MSVFKYPPYFLLEPVECFWCRVGSRWVREFGGSLIVLSYIWLISVSLFLSSIPPFVVMLMRGFSFFDGVLLYLSCDLFCFFCLTLKIV
jgi:hypothetical protein